jgi:hypothetical protein
MGPEEHVTRGVTALREALSEMRWTPAEGRLAQGKTATGEREYE